MQRCLFCSGDASDPDHLEHCCGRQGQIEAAINDDPPIDVTYEPIGHARTSDPETSQAAAANGSGKATQCRRIYELIRSAPAGATCAELVMVTGYMVQSLSRRITDLREQGFVRDSGTRRVSPLSGAWQIVWVERETDDHI